MLLVGAGFCGAADPAAELEGRAPEGLQAALQSLVQQLHQDTSPQLGLKRAHQGLGLPGAQPFRLAGARAQLAGRGSYNLHRPVRKLLQPAGVLQPGCSTAVLYLRIPSVGVLLLLLLSQPANLLLLQLTKSLVVTAAQPSDLCSYLRTQANLRVLTLPALLTFLAQPS